MRAATYGLSSDALTAGLFSTHRSHGNAEYAPKLRKHAFSQDLNLLKPLSGSSMVSTILAGLGRLALGTNYVYRIAMSVILIVGLIQKVRKNNRG